MERLTDSQNGGMNVEINGIDWDGKIDYLDWRKDFSSFVSTWKPLLDFLLETKRNAPIILGFDYQNCL